MDIFKFNNPTGATKMEQGEIINGFKSKMWIERYGKEGEFTLIAPTSSGVREKLPIGSFISHTNTTEIMIVENHEISDAKGSQANIIITGRGYETYLENRIVGSNKDLPASEEHTDYGVVAGFSWAQAVTLIAQHTQPTYLIDDNNEIPFLSVLASVSQIGAAISAERRFTRGTVYSHLLELLAIDNLGIKVVRPGVWTTYEPGTRNTEFIIHKGQDKSASVIFSYDTGEIISADYLWSNKKLKNAALVSGKWVEVIINPSEIKYDRRMMFIDASDLDNAFETAPVGSDITIIGDLMRQRGIDILASLNDVAITKADISPEGIKSKFRSDFEVGDLITVSGDYNSTSTMRVSEYVEIDDITGETGYPTLTME